MNNKITQMIVGIILMSFICTGCATMIKGYEDNVDLINVSNDLKVYSKDGVEIPILSRTVRQYSYEKRVYEDKEIKSIKLRSNKEHILILKSDNKEKVIEIYPKLGGGWFFLDMVTFVVPAIIDAYTGNWQYFLPIDAGL